MDEKIDGAIALTNSKLKAARIKVSIERRGGALWLRATLPPKPQIEGRDAPYQQRISLSVSATAAGLQYAEAKAKLLSSQLDLGRFDWGEWQSLRATPTTVKDWVAQFEADHWNRTPRNQKSEETWKSEYWQVFKNLPGDEALTLGLLLRAIALTPPNSRRRKRFCIYCHKLAQFAKLEDREKIKALGGNYSSKNVNPRSLPTDATIAQIRTGIKNKSWRWVYGMMATYGLRNHEVFRLNLKEFPVVRVEAGKTGERVVYPLYPEWAEEWNLEEIFLPKVNLTLSNSTLGGRITHWFWTHEIPFTAYSLRHCYARRCFQFGLAPDWAAGLMGHSLQVHLETYRAWIDEATYRTAYEKVILRSDRPTPP